MSALSAKISKETVDKNVMMANCISLRCKFLLSHVLKECSDDVYHYDLLTNLSRLCEIFVTFTKELKNADDKNYYIDKKFVNFVNLYKKSAIAAEKELEAGGKYSLATQ
jgi:hypothetical protein